MADWMDFAEAAVKAAQSAGCSYADARVGRIGTEDIEVKNGRVASASAPEDFGCGVRVVRDGCLGFAAAPLETQASRAAAEELGRRAARVAEELGSARGEPVSFAPVDPTEASYETPVEIDPFTLSLADKVDLLRRADASMEGSEHTVVRQATLSSRREEQWQATSDGSRLHQVLVRTGAGISTTAAMEGAVERRSYPASFGGNYLAGGFEHVLAMDLPAHGARVRDESVALCTAPVCEPGTRDLILMGNQLMLQIHESVGHPNELDRVFGHEVDLAGSSFATTEKLGSFQYGSDRVNLVADSTVAGGLDTRGFDDEGVPSTRWHVVEEGRFRGYHTDREWARRIGDGRSHATSRAEGWYHPPIIRITNLSLMPGDWKLEDLVADTERGVVCDTVKMWSIDQRRLNFQFTTEIGWEVEDGVRTRMVRRPTYQGTTPEFWRSCDAVCDASHWQLWGVPNCGKGNPMQVAEMSHGASPARFRGVRFL